MDALFWMRFLFHIPEHHLPNIGSSILFFLAINPNIPFDSSLQDAKILS